MAILTRGLHLDGLCDVADAIGSGAPRERALEILKDSRTGAMGVLAVSCQMILKAGSLAIITKYSGWQYLILCPCLSRWSLNCLSSLSEYARRAEGLGTPFCGKKTRSSLLLAGLTAVVASWFLLELKGLYLFATSIFLAVFSSHFFKRVLGGVTGDCLGAHLELTETIFFMAGAYLCR